MESSQITGDDGEEGCNSSESGWTMYLASPMHGDDDGKASGSEGSHVDDGNGYRHGRRGGKEEDGDDEDDDSLASDASTGPAQVKVPPYIPEGKEVGGGGAKDEGEKEEEDVDDMRSEPSTSSRKKGGKTEKGGRGKAPRTEHSKRGSSSSSRACFFW